MIPVILALRWRGPPAVRQNFAAASGVVAAIWRFSWLYRRGTYSAWLPGSCVVKPLFRWEEAMSTSNISSNFAAAFPRLNTAHELKQSKEDMAALGGALQSQDLAGAKDAFAALMRDSAAAAQGRQAAGQAPLLSDAQRQSMVDAVGALGQELQAGDIDGAQAAYAQLQQASQVFRMASPPASAPVAETPAATPVDTTVPAVVAPDETVAAAAVDSTAEAQAALAAGEPEAAGAAAVQESDVAMTTEAADAAAEASATQSADAVAADELRPGQTNMQSLEDALAAQDLRGAQAAYAALLEDGVNFLQSYQPSADYEPAVLSDGQRADTTQALGQLGSLLQAGDMAGAQAAYEQLQATVQTNRETINTAVGDSAGVASAVDSGSDPAAPASSSVNLQA
jgi:hypothetical protein